MLIKKDQMCLVLVDVQERLLPFVNHSDELMANCKWMLELSGFLGVSQLVTEQYPKGLGSTINELASHLTSTPYEKTTFSIASDEGIRSVIEKQPHRQYALIGIETHVCVLQSALELIEMGKEVFVVTDCVSARSQNDAKYGLKRMKQAGVQLVTKEMVLFEWLRHSKHPEFKEISQRFLKS